MRYSEALTALVRSQLPWRVTRLRELRGLTQVQLAKEVGIARSTLNLLERGESGENLQFPTIVKLAGFFEVGLDYMAGVDHAQIVRAALVSGRDCPECGAPATLHSIPECMVEMADRGRSYGFIAARFRMTLASIEMIIREEHRIRRERRSQVNSGK